MIKKLSIFLCLVAIIASIDIGGMRVRAANEDNEEYNINDEIGKIIDGLDTSDLEEYIGDVSNLLKDDLTFKDLLLSFIKGEGVADYDNAINYVLNRLFGEFKTELPVFVSLFILLLLCSIINALSGERVGGVKEIVDFAGFVTITATVTVVCVSLINNAKAATESISKIIQIVFPILLTLTTVSGGTVQAAVYSPTVLFVGNFVTVFVCGILFPVTVVMLVLSVVSNISKKIKLKGFIDFLASFMKWIIGLVGIIFSIFITIKGLNSGAFDGVSVKTLKYALSSSVPIVGGVVGGGAEIVLAAVGLTKNALGTLSVILIFGVALGPIVKIAATILALRFVNAITQPLANENAYSFINSCVSVMNYAFAGLLLVALMYSVTVIMLLLSAGVMF